MRPLACPLALLETSFQSAAVDELVGATSSATYPACPPARVDAEVMVTLYVTKQSLLASNWKPPPEVDVTNARVGVLENSREE